MNDKSSLEDRLESIGAALRERPSLTGQVMDEVRKSIADGSTADPTTRAPHLSIRRHRRLVAASAGTIATIAAAMLIAITLLPSKSVGWAEVTQAIQSQEWIRGTVQRSNGQRSIMWLAPQRQTWAFDLGGSFYFYDGQQKAKYEYPEKGKTITKLPLGEDDVQRVLPIVALSQDKSAIGPWLLGEKIVEQKRREITEDGQTWVEFQLVLWRGDMNQATLRVDPKTRLPVYLLSSSPKDKRSSKWEFDYPTEGPSDIYALGVPRDIKIDDRMPSDSVLRVLDSIAGSRTSIGDFRLVVGQSPVYPSSVVYRKGNKWRVDSWRPQVAIDSLPEASNDQDWGKWFDEQLQLSQPMSLFVCDGKTVWENSNFVSGEKPRWNLGQHIAPQDLMSGEGLGMLSKAPGTKIASLLFPDLSPKRGWGFDFESKPKDAPDCVLIKRSAELTLPNMIGHEWYYVDPKKGYAVVRADLFNVTKNTPATPKSATARQTITMESFRQSPQGFWYPTVVRDMGSIKKMTRYYFDFNADLPDSLFSVDGVQASQN